MKAKVNGLFSKQLIDIAQQGDSLYAKEGTSPSTLSHGTLLSESADEFDFLTPEKAFYKR